MEEARPAADRTVPDVRFYLPAPELRDLITAYVIVQSSGPLIDNLHPEWANIRFTLGGGWMIEDFGTGALTPALSPALFGPTDRTRQFSSPGGAMLGVGLTPLGWVALIGGNAGAIANEVIELGGLLGLAADELEGALRACADDACRAALLDTVLARRAKSRAKRDPLAVRAHEVLVSGSARTVAEFAGQVGIQMARLNRLCLRVFGFSPKRLLRRQRFLRTLGAVRDAPDQPLTDLIDPAYYDQAHFNRDFKVYMGMTPRAYFNSPRELLRRAAEERRRVVGAPVQGLHPSKAT